MAEDLSVIIPTLDAAATLGRTLDSLTVDRPTLLREIIVADGGSRDATLNIAASHGAAFVRAAPGRGVQLAEGARAASGAWFLFVHADTVPERGWEDAVAQFMFDPKNAMRAAVFHFALDDPSDAARRLEAIVRWRTRALALPYGDQGLLIGRAFYEAIGGFRPLPLMEDVDMVRRIGRRNLATLDVRATTSAERYARSGYLARSARNLGCVTLFFLGCPPRWIARLYG